MHLAVTQKLDPEGDFANRIDENLGDVRVHRNVQIGTKPSRSKKSFRRRATTASSYRPLGDHKSRLLLAIQVSILVAHFDARLDERRR